VISRALVQPGGRVWTARGYAYQGKEGVNYGIPPGVPLSEHCVCGPLLNIRHNFSMEPIHSKGIHSESPGVVVHSERGSQYCSGDYRRLQRDSGLVCGMCKKDDCYDNAAMES
jgi:transposase InsO family protein